MLIWTRHANFQRFENNIYDPSARIVKNSLNSTIFISTQRRVKSTRSHIKFYIEIYLNDTSSQLCDPSTQLCDASNFILKYSSIFRRRVISTWRRVKSTR